MLTDAPPRKNRAQFLQSDRVKSLDVPQNVTSLEIAKRLDSAMKSDSIADVRSACAQFLSAASEFYQVPTCGIPRISRETSTHPRTRNIRAFR